MDLDTPLLWLSEADPWTVRDACEGVQVLGATGSGKTSGSGQAIAKAFLRAGMGGLVLCAKPEERALWERYAAETRRSRQLIAFSAGGPWRFNFLAYELGRAGAGGGFTENVVSLFEQAVTAAGGQGQRGAHDEYWTRALKQLLRNAVELVALARGTVTLADLYDVVTQAAHEPAAVRSTDWQARSACWAMLEQAHGRAEAGDLPPAKRQDFELAAKYWLGEYPALSEKTRSIIVSLFTGMADGFLRSPMRELFCESTNVVPELTHEGAIIVVDLSVLEFADIGQTAQVIWKLLWQKATERRDVARHPRPVFLWADESHYFVTKNDAVFQTTARGARACTVYLTQNLPNYTAALSDKARVDALLGNLNTKIFHANADPVTNKWAAELIARDSRLKASFTRNDVAGVGGDHGGHAGGGVSLSEAHEYQVQPIAFTRLSKGGPQNGFEVEAVFFQSGRRFARSSKTYLHVRFSQCTRTSRKT